MIDNATPIETLFERAQVYSKSTVKLFKLNAIDKSADVVSSMLARLTVIMTVVLSIVIINIGISIWVGKLLGEVFYGFFNHWRLLCFNGIDASHLPLPMDQTSYQQFDC